MTRIALALGALLLSGLAQAGFNMLDVQFSPNATQYTRGDVVTATATSNAAGAQYRFFLEKINNGVVTAVTSTGWSSDNDFQFDTYAVNITPGKYRLRVLARESANRPEVLSKTEIFRVVEPTVTACDAIDGRTYANPTGTTYFAGTLSLGDMLAGVALDLPADINAIAAVSFDAGNVTIELERMTVCALTCVVPTQDFSNAGATVSGTYLCAGNTLTITASGDVEPVPETPAYDLLGGSTFPVSVTGAMTINAAGGTLTAGTATFE